MKVTVSPPPSALMVAISSFPVPAHLGHVGEVESHGEVPMAAVVLKTASSSSFLLVLKI